MQILKFCDCYRETHLAIFTEFTSLDLINYSGIFKTFLGCALGCFQSKIYIIKSTCKLKSVYVFVTFYVFSFPSEGCFIIFKKNSNAHLDFYN